MKKEQIQKNMPYTVVGLSHIPEPRISILLTAEGIHELARRMDKDDMVRIEEWSDITNNCENKKHYGRITIIKKTQ